MWPVSLFFLKVYIYIYIYIYIYYIYIYIYIYIYFERPAGLATLKSSDRTKQSVCGWQYIYIYNTHTHIYIYIYKCIFAHVYTQLLWYEQDATQGHFLSFV